MKLHLVLFALFCVFAFAQSAYLDDEEPESVNDSGMAFDDASGSGSGSGSSGSGSNAGSGSGSGSGTKKSCDDYTTCGPCNEDDDCGWCASTGKCHKGTVSGPLNGTCTTWSFAACFNNTACSNSTIKGCTACIAASNNNTNSLPFGCGYCQQLKNSYCSVGTIDGPYGVDENCNGLWRYDTCHDEDICSPSTDCGSCVNSTQCGWCGDSCVSGSFSGPFDKSQTCSVWVPPGTKVSNGSCLLACDKFPDCFTCVVDGGCGWCQTNKTNGVCTEVDEDGPINKNLTCKALYPTFKNPTCPEPSDFECSDYSANCTQCLEATTDNNFLCAWCESSQECIEQGDDCDIRREGTCDDTCSQFADCGSCATTGLCGWCDGNCVAGGATNATFSVCKAYDYQKCPCSIYSSCASCATQDDCGWCTDNSGSCLNSTKSSTDKCNADLETKCPSSQICDSADCNSCGHGAYSDCTWCINYNNGRQTSSCFPKDEKKGQCGKGCSSSLSGGQIFGIIFGVLVVAGIAGFAGFVIYRRHQRASFERLL